MQEIKKIPIILYSDAFCSKVNTYPSIRQAAKNAKCTEGELIDAILLGTAIKHKYEPVKIGGYEVYADYLLSEDNYTAKNWKREGKENDISAKNRKSKN